MFCSNCGNKINENEQFCSNCGVKINDDLLQNNTNIINKKKNIIPLLFGIGCFSIILLMVMFGIMLTGIFKDMKEENSQKEVLDSEKFIGVGMYIIMEI